MMEKWRQIEGQEGYEVSTFGRVRSYWPDRSSKVPPSEPKILAHCFDQRGYPMVGLKASRPSKYRHITRRVHRLVAESFIPNPDKLPQVNHKDGDKLNNHVSNLEWISNADNATHAGKNNLYATGLRSGMGKWPDAMARAVQTLLNGGVRPIDVSRVLGVPTGSLYWLSGGRKQTWTYPSN